ncbi:MAG: DNA polymerase III subunit alpha, partial [Flavobacteriales bacterium]|nr:DNA polymerase III subunit alpha [Flavobacteriales bacterium]
LNAHSWFSFNYGILSPEEVLQHAHDLGLQAVALTDINCSAGHSDFFRLAERYQVRPVAGIEFRKGARTLYVCLALDQEGLRHANELLTTHLYDGEALPERPGAMPGVAVIYPYGAAHAPQKPGPNEFIGVRPGDVDRMRFSDRRWPKDRLLAMVSATFRHKRDHNVHRLLRAVDTNTLLSTTAPEQVADAAHRFLTEEQICRAYASVPELVWNTRRLMDRCDVHFNFGRSKNRKVWRTDPHSDLELLREEACAGLQRRYAAPNSAVRERFERELTVIAQKDFVSYFLINWDLVRFAKHKGFFHVGRGSGANSLVAYCLGITDVDPIELDLYFERFINPSRSSPPDFDIDFSWKDRDQVTGYLFDRYGGGRRVALLATYSTYQYRAVIRELGKVFGLPPEEIDALADPRIPKKDSDLDQVARTIMRYSQHLHEHPHHLSIHVGGVLISEDPLTCYTALHRPPKGFATTQFSMLEAEDLGLYKFDILSQRGLGHIRDAVELVERGSDDQMIRRSENGGYGTDELVGSIAAEPIPATRQFVNASTRNTIDIHAIEQFKHDPRINELLRTGNTIGCFYVESPAMRMLLKKLEVTDYPTLVAASSIIRPGVAQSGMMREYILRHRDPERRKQAHPAMHRIMPDTYGVMVYQEDVIKVAHLYAGLTLAEADILRRGMSGKYRSRAEFQRVKDRFFSNCAAKGYPQHEVAEIWRQIESFAGYSFAKGHSASYAVESYQSLYLKAYHPMEFMVAVANNFGGFYHTEFYLHEARRGGAVIEAPCINRSEELCALVRSVDEKIRRSEDGNAHVERERELVNSDRDDTATIGHHLTPSPPHSLSSLPRIFLGLQNIKGMDSTTAARILHERRRRGPYSGLPDLLHRVPIQVE